LLLPDWLLNAMLYSAANYIFIRFSEWLLNARSSVPLHSGPW
jgi:hypothetical protein